MSQLPKLSIVVTSRNDDHGGEMFRRMTIFMKALLYQTKKFQLPSELLFVEWNPPADKPLLHEVLPKPQAGDYLTVRYIVVPSKIHAQYRMGTEIPLFQMIAKNIGIRRAKSDFILCSNVDLVFSDKLMEILKKDSFHKDSYYRASRHDVPATIQTDWEMEKVLDFCRDNVLTRLGKDPRFLFGGGWPDQLPRNDFTMWLIDRINYLRIKWFYNEVDFKLRPLDAQACGDFTMMHRDAWNDIKGYLELDLYSLHIDTFALMMAIIRGYKQVVFPSAACTFHMEHDTGWETMNPIQKIKFWGKRPGVSHDLIWEATKYMLHKKETLYINDDNWGMPQEDFQEITLSPS